MWVSLSVFVAVRFGGGTGGGRGTFLCFYVQRQAGWVDYVLLHVCEERARMCACAAEWNPLSSIGSGKG